MLGRMKLSIITINFNNSVGLERTIRSVISQTYTDIEYIIVDGGSTDGSIELIKNYESEISYWVSEKDSGVYNAMNKGIKVAKGEFLLFLNSGDYLCNEHVINKLLAKGGEEADLIYGNLERAFPDGRKDVAKMPASITVERMMNGTLCHPVTLIKRQLFKRYGLYDENLKIVADWAFFLKAIVLGHARGHYVDVNVAVFSMDGVSSWVSSTPLIKKEKEWVMENYLSPALINFIKEKQYLEYYHKQYKITPINNFLKKGKAGLKKAFLPASKVTKKISNVKRSFLTNLQIKAYKKKFQAECFNIPIIINNRNHLTYLKRLITSLEKRGYKNIFVIDNNSDFPPLLEYYEKIPYKVFLLDKNVGFCALWDTYVFNQFRDQFYVYTDSDIEIIEECPDDFMVVMHYLLNKYRKLGKVGFSLLTDDLPEHFSNRKEVIEWEAQFQVEKIEKLAYAAPVDTTFALYQPNCFGTSFALKGARTSFPYAARHLPWYENTRELTNEQVYYYQNAKAISHWSKKIKVADT